MPPSKGKSPLLKVIWRDHVIPIGYFVILTLLITWPTLMNFTTRLVSSGGDDPRHNLWVLWHVKEALLGNQNLFDVNLIYYPFGASLLTHGVGPVTGLFALPFWPWGLEAAHNGAVLVSFVLTGYFMFLFARSLNFSWGVALFAGTMFFLAPMHLVGLYGHISKAFMGLLPLTLLMLRYSLDLTRRSLWVVGVAVTLLLTALHQGHQFIFLVLVIPIFVIVAFLQTPAEQRRPFIKRVVLMGVAILVIVAPLIWAILQASAESAIVTSAKLRSLDHVPDVVQLLLPPPHSLLFGEAAADILTNLDVRLSLETAVFVSWLGLVLSVVALWKKQKKAYVWAGLTVATVLLALGPVLQLFGERTFTDFELPILMPFAILTELPGLDFIRTPGRFMMFGALSLTVTASYGLAWLTQRYAKYATVIIVLAFGLIFLESWPQPWQQEKLRPIPAFYQQIATEEEEYGVFDLPIKPTPDGNYITYSAQYQMYQVVHGKGIHTAYLSRTYQEHPLFNCIIPSVRSGQILFVNGEPSKCFANFLYDLNQANYRYIVWHKPKAEYRFYKPDSESYWETANLIYQMFGETAPLVDDELVTVYAVPGVNVADLTTTLNVQNNWYPLQNNPLSRWADSPATLTVTSPKEQNVVLEITPGRIFVPGEDSPFGEQGQLQIEIGETLVATVPIQIGEITAVPLTIPAGRQTITLSLEAGSFHPSDYGLKDERSLSFEVRAINLKTQE